METNLPIWAHYQPGFIDPLFRPYTRTDALDHRKRMININRTPYTSLAPSGPIDPGMVRRGWGLRFQLMHPNDPCPSGFTKDPSDGYCYRHEPEFEQVFYSDKAFLARNQFWGGFVDSKPGPFGTEQSTPAYRPSNEFDLRSVDPLTGYYHVYYPGHNIAKQPYASLTTRDSYLA